MNYFFISWLNYKLNFRKADNEWECCGTCKEANVILLKRFWCNKTNIDLPDQLPGTICDLFQDYNQNI
jgi:hypothetical protein